MSGPEGSVQLGLSREEGAGLGAEAQPQDGQAGQVESLVRFELGCGFHTMFWWRVGRDLGPLLYL